MSASSAALRLAGDAPILRMHDLGPAGPAANLAEAAQARAARQSLLLRAGEVKEAQRQRAGAIADPAQQLAAAAKRDFAELHLAFDDRALADSQRADRHDARAVFVAQRQQEQQILHCRDAELRQLLGERLADAAQRRDGAQLRRLSGRALRRRCRSLQLHDAVDLDARALGQRRDCHGRRAPDTAR